MQTVSNAVAEGEFHARDWRMVILALVPAFLILLVGALIQSQTYLNHDVAWVLNSSERLLEGGTFGRDIVASNPPLIWWMSAAVAGIADALGTDPVATFRAAIAIGVAGLLALLNHGLSTVMNPTKRAVFLAFLALILTVGAHRDFGQREHLTVALCLPWLLLVVGQRVHPGYALMAGIAAGVGICFKPHFLAVPALVWAYVALRDRSLRPVLRLDTAAILLTGVAYVAATWVFARPYLTEVVPLISQVYWGFEHPVSAIITKNPWPSVMTFAALLVAWRSTWQPLPSVTALAAAGFLIAALAQAKGYSYHYYPAMSFALISLALSGLTLTRPALRALALMPLMVGVVIAGIQSAFGLASNSPSGKDGQHTACLVGMVQEHVPHSGGFMAFSTHPYPGFPIANYSDRRWVAATNSRLFLPSIVRLRAEANLSAEAARVLALAETHERAAALKDLNQKPQIVLIDDRERRHAIGHLPMDFLAFYAEDPAFAQVWANYQEIPSCAPGIRAFKRS